VTQRTFGSVPLQRQAAVVANRARVYLVAIDVHADTNLRIAITDAGYLHGVDRCIRDAETPAYCCTVERKNLQAVCTQPFVGLISSIKRIVPRLPRDCVCSNRKTSIQKAIGLVMANMLLDGFQAREDRDPYEDDAYNEEKKLLLAHRVMELASSESKIGRLTTSTKELWGD